MVMLLESDVQTKEVLAWKGLHLFHFAGSSCSQKLRIFLRLKGIDYEPHHINLARGEQLTPFYMGINPRGLVPTLVHDGQVIIESNDILCYLEDRFPEPVLIPTDKADGMAALLKTEDDLHLDIRSLSMRYVFPSFMVKKPETDLTKYERSGSGKVGGEPDTAKARELNFWRNFNANKGIPDDQIRAAFTALKAVLDGFEAPLSGQRYLLGDAVSLLDIAWYIYAKRLSHAGYPLDALHPHVAGWFDRLDRNPDFSEEVPDPVPLVMIRKALHLAQRIKGTSLSRFVRVAPGLDAQ